jgi:hypothetical protein
MAPKLKLGFAQWVGASPNAERKAGARHSNAGARHTFNRHRASP